MPGISPSLFGVGGRYFSLTNPATPLLWLKADSYVGADGDAVTTWSDSSGNANNAAGVSTSKPLYKTGIINGKPVMRFDGVNDYMTVTRNAGLEPAGVTIFMVALHSGSIGASKYLLSKKYTTGSTASYAIGSGADNTHALRCVFRSTASNPTTGAITDATVWDASGHVLMGVTALSLLGSVYFGGAIISSVALASALAYDASDLFIGAYDSTQLYAAVDIAEILVYSALTVPQQGIVHQYLKDKYALAA